MSIVSRCPAVAYVAGVAFLRGVKMTRVRAGGSYAIVTGRAGAKHLRVINCHYGRKHIRGVAVLANIGCQDVRWILAGRVCAVMAAHAVTRDVDVVKVGRQPGNCAVTVIAVVTTRNVGRMFAGGSDAVMAGSASPDYLGVIDDENWLPHSWRVAVFTDVRRQWMCWTLARCVRTVMAVDAVARNGRVIECRGQPASGGVTVIAGVTARNMRRMLTDR